MHSTYPDMASVDEHWTACQKKSRVPLSVVLQGDPSKCKTTIFMLPDGSGSGMAYARMPPIAPDTCLVGLNSPFLRCPAEYKCTIEDMARNWSREIQQRQPHGPYVLGGWSAGGYYAYEVAEELQRQGEKVDKLILLDSPCRPDFEELPIELVQHLAANGLMGNWGGKNGTPPTPVVEHFRSTLRAVRQYVPTPSPAPPAAVYIIWSGEGVMEEAEAKAARLDLCVKVSRFLLLGKPNFGPHGWDRLFPGAESAIQISAMSGNHFTLISPPHVSPRRKRLMRLRRSFHMLRTHFSCRSTT